MSLSPFRLGAAMVAVTAAFAIAVVLWIGPRDGGIGSSPSPTPSPTPQPSPSFIDTSPFSGRWSTNLPAQAVPQGVTCDVPNDCMVPPAGAWSMQIVGRFLTFLEPSDYWEQRVTEVTETAPGQGTLLFTVQDQCFLFTSPDHREGRYRWQRQGDRLTFEVIEDDCVDRILLFTKSVWAPGDAPLATPLPTADPAVLQSPRPVPEGLQLPAGLLGREYDVEGESAPPGEPRLVLTLRVANDPHCTAALAEPSTCFTILWKPGRATLDDPGARGAALLDGEELVLHYQYVPNDLPCEDTQHRYAIENDGATLRATEIPECGFPGFVAVTAP